MMREKIRMRECGCLGLQSWFREGSLASIWRYRPTPESSEGAGEPSPFGVTTRVTGAPLVCETLRVRFPAAPSGGRVLVFHSGLWLVTVDLAALWPSSDCCARRGAGVPAWVRRLAGRGAEELSPETSRVPNLAFADDSRP